MSESIESILARYPEISFIGGKTLESVRSEMLADYKAKYKELTGGDPTVGSADPAKMVLDAAALQIYQAYQYIDQAGKMGLLKYSSGSYLDNLAALRGVERIQSTPAVTTLRFSLAEARSDAVAIPSGTRCTNAGGKYFATDSYAEIPAGATYVDVQATCTESGASGNGINDIDTIVDPIPYVSSVTCTVSSGGADTESDASLKERAYVAPGSYSTAGPKLAYEYWVRKFVPDAADVQVPDSSDGNLIIRYITASGIPTAEMCAKLEAELDSAKIRPLTDHVSVEAPSVIKVSLDVTYYIASSSSGSVAPIQAQVAAAVADFKAWQAGKIGRDINPDALVQRLMAAGAKRVTVASPTYTKIDDASIAVVSSETIRYGGIEDD